MPCSLSALGDCRKAQRTAALLMEAHASGKAEDLQHATGQLQRALDAEGWAA